MDEGFEKGMEPTEYAISDDDRDEALPPLLPSGLPLEATCITWCERLFLNSKFMLVELVEPPVDCLAWDSLDLACSLARVN